MKISETSAAAAEPSKTRVKDRIFDAACDLFYRQGIRAVGVDAIACEAGTNKMSFYRSFASKDDLVAEYLRDSAQDFWDWWDGVIAPYAGKPRRQIEALFEAYVDKPCGKSESGCPLANAAVEIREEGHPGLAVVRGYKAEIRRRLRAMAQQAGARKYHELGDALMLLMEGGFLSRLTFGPECGAGPIANAAGAARILLQAHLPKK
jgi:AcrR family transcriptional regulator